MQKWFYYIIKLFFPLLQGFTSLIRKFHISCGLFLAELSLFYYQIVLSSSTKIFFFISDISHLLWFISFRIESILLSNCSFLYNKVLLLYFIYFFSHEVFFLYNPFYFIIKLLFPLLQRFSTLFHLFHLLWGLFLAELILFYYQIVLSSTTKIYLYSPFIRRLIRSFSCRTHSMLLLNCSFLYNKDLLLYYNYFTSQEVFFL